MSLLPDFPSSPTNGQVATVGDYSYTYNSTTDSWEGVLGGSSGSGTFAQLFTSSGTFTVPTGVTAVKVTVIGGGGGGGGTNQGCAGGGGAGGVAIRWISALTPGSSIAVTIGSAGAGGAAPSISDPVAYTNGSSGGTSSFGSYASASGGTGGSGAFGASYALGGAGGTGSNGTINFSGGRGAPGISGVGGAGGGSGGANGSYTTSADYIPAGTAATPGGNGYLGGAGAPGTVANSNGSNATGWGNGGAGGAPGGTIPPVAGGAGSAGIVLVEWSASVLVVNTTTGGGIGYDQSWTDVSGSRTFGVTYTNSTTKPIQILVGASTTGAGGGVALTINGVALPGSFAYSPSVTVFSATAIVPVGATYAASAYGGASYASWHELR